MPSTIKTANGDEITISLPGVADARYIATMYRERGNNWLADVVESQIPKPAIEEPKEFGSIVRAWRPEDPKGVAALLWHKSPRTGHHYWQSENGDTDVWSELRYPEVLRVGIGEAAPSLAERVYLDPMDDAPDDEVNDVAPEETSDYIYGVHDTISAVRRKLHALRDEAITAERQNAYDKAIKAMEAL